MSACVNSLIALFIAAAHKKVQNVYWICELENFKAWKKDF